MSQKTDIPIYQVDAFTDRPFGGNPAAVCLLDQPRDAVWMQSVAAEMNLSETAFLVPEGAAFGLRWFTPQIEVPLCGHATLASAHTLWETGKVESDQTEIRFATRSGQLIARRVSRGIELDFPAITGEKGQITDQVARAIPASPERVAIVVDDSMPGVVFVLELASADAVREVEPDLSDLRRPDAPSIIVTARSDSDGVDFVSRCFFPSAGIDEDPVTGAAHCVLATYWRDRLGRDEMVAYQASRRGGTLGIRVSGDRVRIAGAAVTVLRGSLIA
ncbi:MAG: PhzF family phenazine biosynthesis protein [Proteobacteria bacterium]|nr:PhzF family phenazine biosynthesis protein [Pseudomonadota bacterium]